MDHKTDAGSAMKDAAQVGLPAGVVTWTTLFGQPVETWILWGTFILTGFWIWGQVKLHILNPWRARRAAIKTKRLRSTD